MSKDSKETLCILMAAVGLILIVFSLCGLLDKEMTKNNLHDYFWISFISSLALTYFCIRWLMKNSKEYGPYLKLALPFGFGFPSLIVGMIFLAYALQGMIKPMYPSILLFSLITTLGLILFFKSLLMTANGK